MSVRIITGDCREVMPQHGPFDMILADPPYGDTCLEWDKRVAGWESVALESLKPTGSMWVFGSMRFFMATGPAFHAAGWRYAQDVVWEKHNGSGFNKDRFRRVHEHAVQFYRADAPWGDVFNDVQTTPDAVKRVVARSNRPKHRGEIGPSSYASEEGGPRIMRSVISMRSMHGSAIHPTEKPSALLEILIRTSCTPGGLVGDFFAGSGAGGEASAIVERDYIGCELYPDIAQDARDRLDSHLFSATRTAA